MAREIQVLTLCDPCLAADQRIDGQEVTISLSNLYGGKPAELALCERHRKEFYEPLELLLAELGAPVSKASSKKAPKPSQAEGGDFPCPVDDCHLGPYDTRGQLQSHVRRSHDTTLAELMGEPTPFACDQPNCGRAFGVPQALAVHRSRSHGLYAER